MTKASKWGLTVLLMLLMAACSSEMPLPGDPAANSVVAPRNLLPLQQVPRRIGAMWASLPRQTLTRAGDEPVVDFRFPGEENEQTVSKESYCYKTKIVTGIRPQ